MKLKNEFYWTLDLTDIEIINFILKFTTEGASNLGEIEKWLRENVSKQQ